MRYWWVNQNQTYKSEVEGGFLWSPKSNKNRAKNKFYDNMADVRSGDIILSFCDTEIKAIGIALEAAKTSERPDFGSVGEQWAKEGWHLPVRFSVVKRPVKPKDFIDELEPFLPAKYSPLRADGKGNQGVYLAEISEDVASIIISKMGLEISDFKDSDFNVEEESPNRISQSSSNAFLLTWKAEHWGIENIERLLTVFERDGEVQEDWRLISTRKAQPGDTVWVLQQGSIYGIFARGKVVGPQTQVVVGDKIAPGFPILFDNIVDPRNKFIIDPHDVLRILDKNQWAAQASGNALRPEQAYEFEKIAGLKIDGNLDFNSAIKRTIQTALNTIFASSGPATLKAPKLKTFGFKSRAEFEQYVIKLFREQNNICALTGIEMKPDGHPDEQLYASLDRIDSNLGYAPNNLQYVCRFANRWKGADENSEFLGLIGRIKLCRE